MFVWILRNLRATLCNYMEGWAVLTIFNFETDNPVCMYVCIYVCMYVCMYYIDTCFSQMRHCMNVCMLCITYIWDFHYLCMYVICIYKRTKEFKCYLVQMMLTLHHRNISDSQPMISLNGPKQLVAVRY